MKTTKPSQPHLLHTAAAALILLAAAPQPSHAASQTWDGGAAGTGTAWFTVANWVGDTAFPGANGSTANTDIATVKAGTGGTLQLNMTTAGGNFSLGGLEFQRTTAGTWNNNVATPGILRLNGATVGGVANTLVRLGTGGNLTIADGTGTMGLALGNANGIFEVTNSQTLTIGSLLSEIAAGNGFQKNGAGILLITNNNTSLSGGNVQINQGTLRLSTSTNALGGPTGPTIQLGATSGSDVSTLELGSATTNANNITVRTGSAGTKTLGVSVGSTMSFSGNVTVNDNLTVAQNQSSGTFTVSGTASTIATGKTVSFTNSGAGGGLTDSAIWTGLGGVAYGGNNSGNITVIGAKDFSGGAALNAMSGAGVVAVSTSTTGPANAPTSGPFGTGTLTMGATKLRSTTTADTTIGNAITIAGNPTFSTLASEKSLIFTGNADLGAATRTITGSLGSTVVGKYVEFQGVISGAATVGIIKAGAGTLTLSGANTFTGTTIISSGTLTLGNVNAIQNTTGITIGGASTAALSTSTDGITIGVPITTANSGINSTIFFGRGTANVGTLTLNGAIGGNGNLIFSTPNASSGGQSQTVILGAAGTYGGTTTITTANLNNTTVIRADVANALPTNTVLTLSPGVGAGSGRTTTFDLNGNNQTLAGLASIAVMPDLRSIRVSSTAAATLTINGTTANTYGGTGPSGQTATMTGAISLVKDGTGTQTLTGAAHSFTGSTTILGGTLALSGIGSIANTPSIAVSSGATFDVSARTSAFTLGAAQTLSGNGTVTGPITIDGTAAAGASVGTLTFSSIVTNNGTILAEITNGPSADKLVFNGSFHNLGGTLTVTSLGSLTVGTTYDLFDFSSAPTGVAFAATNLPNGLSHWLTGDLLVGGTITFTNMNPVAQNLTAGVVHGGTVTLPVIGGKNGATDADGDSMTVTAVGTPTSGSVTTNATSVIYTASGDPGTNTFTYTVTDAFGGTDTKTVTVVVANPQGFNQVSAGVDGGNAVLQYLGIPGTNYALEITHALPATNWVPVITNPASVNGYLYFTNPISLSPTNDYYRTRYAP